MARKLDQWTTTLSAVLLVAALLACKKRAPSVTAPSAEPAATAATAAAAPAAATPSAVALVDAGAKLGEVKRYTDIEKAQTGTLRIVEDGAKVFGEADDKTAEVATLSKGLLVSRLASIPDWELVEFPSGVGKVSPGWVQAKFFGGDAAAQAKPPIAKSTSSATPKASAVASTAKPPGSATAAPKTPVDQAAADKAAADKAAAEAAAARAARIAERAAARAKAAAEKAAAGQ